MSRSWSDEELESAFEAEMENARRLDQYQRPPDPTCAPITPRGEERREVETARSNDHLRTSEPVVAGRALRTRQLSKLPPSDPWPPGGERACTVCGRALRESSFGSIGWGYVIPFGGGVGRVVCRAILDETGRQVDCEWKLSEDKRKRRVAAEDTARLRAQGDRQAGQVRRLRGGGRE